MKRRRSRSSSCGSWIAPFGIPDRLDQERDRVEPEAAQPLLEPEAGDLRDLVAHLRVGDVEVRLVGVEAVQVPPPRLSVVRPVGVLLVGEDDVAGLLRRLLVGPDVEVVVRVVAARARAAWNHGCWSDVWFGTRSAITRMPRSRAVRTMLDDVAVRAEPRVDAVEVRDVVAVVALARRVERHQPEAGDADAGEVVDALA